LVCANCASLVVMPLSVTDCVLAFTSVTCTTGDVVDIDCPPKATGEAFIERLKLEVGTNFASTLEAAVAVTLHVPSPVHAPVHPANTEPADAVAVSVRVEPLFTFIEQVAPHEMPEGFELTLPEPLPERVTVMANVGGGGGKSAGSNGRIWYE